MPFDGLVVGLLFRRLGWLRLYCTYPELPYVRTMYVGVRCHTGWISSSMGSASEQRGVASRGCGLLAWFPGWGLSDGGGGWGLGLDWHGMAWHGMGGMWLTGHGGACLLVWWSVFLGFIFQVGLGGGLCGVLGGLFLGGRVFCY